ncbi:MAG TPA: MFS transporter [Candidatus Limnocylindrales bacterium]|nr:MFS transporter [Candidatus Limnocylindrales bacterium]
MSRSETSPSARLDRWLERWGEVVPLLLAEFIVWLGFGALLPVLPLYFTEQGVDLALLGLVIAAWPAARLVGEPFFGWLADRTARIPLMVAGLLATGVFSILPLVFTGPLAFLVLRAGAGLSTAAYDPAARGYLTDATPPERRGEAFGLYGAVQMGGLLFGPAIGALGANAFGGISFVFVFGGIAAWLAAIPIGLRGRETGQRTHPAPPPDAVEFPSEAPFTTRRAAADFDADRADGAGRSAGAGRTAPSRLWNRGLVAALVINAGGYFAGGTYEVIWSLFLQHLGAGLDLIGFSFAMFGLPVLLLSPYAGRLVDRRGSIAFIVAGSLLPAAVAIVYTTITDPLFAIPLILLEATGFAMLNPALYAVVASSSPAGRSSTAQGLFGAAGTVGFIVASLIAGVLASANIVYPLYVFSAVLVTSLILGLLIGGRRLDGRGAVLDRGGAMVDRI